MKNYLHKLHKNENLTSLEIESVMHEIMAGSASKDDIMQFLLALRAKGPTVEEITGAAKIMRQFALSIQSHHPLILDTCGTGGDKRGTFNISTISAFVVAGAGVPVAKHGNRSVSSQCGSADILEGLGVNLNLTEDQLSQCLDKIGIAFLFAQKLHPAMKNVASIRKELGVETIFNVLGPLTNPAHATHQMMGVYNRDLVEPLAEVLKNLGLKKALVVHGSDGLDEITTTGPTFFAEYNGQEIFTYDVSPEEVGIKLAHDKDIKGGDLQANLKIANEILQGETGARRDIVVLNAAYALYLTGKAKNINEGVILAGTSLDTGKALEKLNDLKRFSQQANK